jgi:hypothetical protein
MAKITTKTFLLALLTVVSSTALSQTAQAQTISTTSCTRTSCASAPEIDPAQALGALTLLSGAVAIFRGVRRKSK